MSSCSEDMAAPEPAYIFVENIFFDTDSVNGSNSSVIIDAWPSVDGQSLGANSLPALFPVVPDPNFQTNSIRIAPGIQDNGISGTRAIYPFYLPYTTTLKLQPGKIDTFRPMLDYDPAATVIVVDDFESPTQPAFNDDLDGNPNTFMRYQTQEVFEGNYSGELVLDSANLECTIATSTRFFNVVNVSATPVYLELNYKTNSPFEIGLVAHYNAGNRNIIYKGGMNPTETWKKIYFNLTTEVFGSNAPQYSVVIRALRLPNFSNPKAYVDNIKLLHY